MQALFSQNPSQEAVLRPQDPPLQRKHENQPLCFLPPVGVGGGAGVLSDDPRNQFGIHRGFLKEEPEADWGPCRLTGHEIWGLQF